MKKHFFSEHTFHRPASDFKAFAMAHWCAHVHVHVQLKHPNHYILITSQPRQESFLGFRDQTMGPTNKGCVVSASSHFIVLHIVVCVLWHRYTQASCVWKLSEQRTMKDYSFGIWCSILMWKILFLDFEKHPADVCVGGGIRKCFEYHLWFMYKSARVGPSALNYTPHICATVDQKPGVNWSLNSSDSNGSISFSETSGCCYQSKMWKCVHVSFGNHLERLPEQSGLRNKRPSWIPWLI